jgi:hypothetical protein
MEDATCRERMEAQNNIVRVMFDQIRTDVGDIKADLRALTEKANGFVSWAAFEAKCKEIEGLKKFVWGVTGGFAVINLVVIIVLKFWKP